MSSSSAYFGIPEWHFGTSSSPPFPNPPPRSPLRQQIIKESRQHNWTKAPRFNGQATFDLRNGLRQVPFAKSKCSTNTKCDYSSPVGGSYSSPVSNFSHELDSPISGGSSCSRQRNEYCGSNVPDFSRSYQVKDATSPISSEWSTVSFDDVATPSFQDSSLDDPTQVVSSPSSQDATLNSSSFSDRLTERASHRQPLETISIPRFGQTAQSFLAGYDVPYNHTSTFNQRQTSIHDEIMRELDSIHHAAIASDSHRNSHCSTNQTHQSDNSLEIPATKKTETVQIESENPDGITESQLIEEVKDIYRGLIMAEKVRVDIVQHQSHSLSETSQEKRSALIALHRTLLHEHHDFFAATQHRTSSPALRTLATRFAMPERMWEQATDTLKEMLCQSKLYNTEDLKQIIFLQSLTLKSLKKNVPSMLHQWIEVEEKLKEYLYTLKRYGIDISQAEIEDFEIHQTQDVDSSHFCSEHDPNSWNQKGMTLQNFEDGVSLYPKERDWERKDNRSIMVNLPDIALFLAGGWLLYGQVIADNFNFDTFCRVFKLIAYAGVQMTAPIGRLSC